MCTVRQIQHQTDILDQKLESTVGLFLTALNKSEERTTLPRLSEGTVVTLYAQGRYFKRQFLFSFVKVFSCKCYSVHQHSANTN